MGGECVLLFGLTMKRSDFNIGDLWQNQNDLNWMCIITKIIMRRKNYEVYGIWLGLDDGYIDLDYYFYFSASDNHFAANWSLVHRNI